MTSKYALAKTAIEDLTVQADSAGIEPGDAQEALLISLVQALKAEQDPAALRSLLQYELDNLGSGRSGGSDEMHDLPRGGGHS